ncbi:DUF1028 domain-containing protein [Pelagibius sp. 7325]|uniref:DUF1028 domain-containing protein n=1 Tax=Pelagibius sp. 7325 TaxID=3131994 RepID=UPI0030EBC054
MTFTIIGRDPANGAIGVATATGSIAVGAQVPHCRFGVGAVATQGYSTNVLFARRGLPRLSGGESAGHVLRALLAEDEGRDFRQLAVMDREGRTAGWTGTENSEAKGLREGDNWIAAGNLLSNATVLQAMAEAYAADDGEGLAERLLTALAAGEAAGGDSRGTCSAALLVDSGQGAALNLRVDYDPRPVEALQALYERSKDAVYRDFLKRLPDEQDPSRR